MNNDLTLDQIRERIRHTATSEEAIGLLNTYIAAHPEDDEALTMRGMRYFSMGRRADALKDYMAAVRLNPSSKAAMAIRASYDILNYYNKDLYNP
ncbi:MAG: hypothetical protein K2J29_01925 [Muribaculaceae bacterium]|nr:hypothetical protein [Muribaculaceae bacterium]MDE7188986.1 hypothetical protein [Muribaculaceae bacterium]